jgi:hypothetical protein
MTHCDADGGYLLVGDGNGNWKFLLGMPLAIIAKKIGKRK